MIFYNYNQVRTFIILLAGFYLMFLPILLRAQVLINEIMYDPEGSDTGREWVEVYNSGAEDVDLATYKLFESNVNHKLIPITDTGISILKSHDFAILADNPEKFLIDFPNFTELLFDSTFSLNNTGEPLAIVDGVGTINDKFEYSGDLGGNNNGKSLQRNNLGFWIESLPTVGTVNNQEAQSTTNVGGSNQSATSSTSSPAISSLDSNSNTISTHASQVEITQYIEKSGLEIGLGRDRFSNLHMPIEFKAQYNTDKKPKFMWSWGDGSFDLGYKVNHIYENTGVYNVILNAFLNGYQATSRIKTQISSVSVDILYITYGKLVDIVLKNTSDNEVNLGGFTIYMDSDKFEIPTDTIINAKTQIIIPAKYTGFEISSSTKNNIQGSIKLYYPDGFLYKEKILIPTSTNS